MTVFCYKKNHTLLQDAFVCKVVCVECEIPPGPEQPESTLPQNNNNTRS